MTKLKHKCTYNWTQRQLKVILTNPKNLAIGSVCIPMEHADAWNADDVIGWAKDMGWYGQHLTHMKTVLFIYKNAPATTYLHVTEKSNLPSIQERGLTPRIGPRAIKIPETVPYIYLFKDRNTAGDAVMNWLGDEFPDETELVMLEIKLPKGYVPDLIKTPDAPYEIKCVRTIPAEFIAGIEKL